MRKLNCAAIVLPFALTLTPTPAPAQDDGEQVPTVGAQPSREELQKLYMDYLSEEGYRPKIDDDGDVLFKHEGGNYFIRVDAEDPQFFQLNFPNFWPIEDEDERRRAHIAAGHVSATCKVAKAYVVEDDLWISVELFLESPEQFKPLFARSLQVLGDGRSMFVEKMEELKDENARVDRLRLDNRAD